jgi:kinetochore protein Spc24, fungi type
MRGRAEEVVEREHGGPSEDEVLLRLKVYRSLGIDVEAEEGTGQFERAVVRNRERGDVRVVNIEPRFSRKFYADYFWGSI